MSEGTTLLPDPDRFQLIHLEATATALTAVAATIAPSAICPLCGKVSTHVHSRYVRSVADLPWRDIPFRLRLHVRRFFCDEPTCPRVTFAERLPGLVAPHARRTERFEAWVRSVGFALGGEAGTRLLRVLGLASTSPATLLRHVRRAPVATLPAAAKPRVVGIDDWCFRRGQRYGAIVVDLERRQVLDLLPDREAGTVATWLREHPTIEIVSRDRGATFAEGATQGAPHAVQVADRFHVLKNLMEAFQRVLGNEHAALHVAAQVVAGSPLSATPRPLTAPERDAREQAQARRQSRYEVVHRLRDAGKTIREIATELHEPSTWDRTRFNGSCVWRLAPFQHNVNADRRCSVPLSPIYGSDGMAANRMGNASCARFGSTGMEEAKRPSMASWDGGVVARATVDPMRVRARLRRRSSRRYARHRARCPGSSCAQRTIWRPQRLPT